MESYIIQFLKAQETLMEQFKCDTNYFIKPLVNSKWALKIEESAVFLTYCYEKMERVTLVVSRKEGNPEFYKSNEYTMIVAIDCIKIAFIFKNNNVVDSL